MKKQIKLILVPLYLTSCTTTQIANKAVTDNKESVGVSSINLELDFLRLSSCAEENAQRAPSSQISCQKYYEADKTISETDKKKVKEAVLSEITGKTRVIEQFGQTENLGLWAMYFGSSRVKEFLKAEMHPVEFLKDADVKAFSKAWRNLRDASDEKFVLSTELMSDVNKLLQGDVETSVLQEMNSRLATETAERKSGLIASLKSNLQSYFSGSQSFRSKAMKQDFSFETVNDVDYANIKRNIEAVGGKVEETNFSGEKARSFVVYSPKGESVRQQVATVLNQAQRQIAHLKNASYSEKIDFVADLHLKLLAISPFAKLNDLTVQMTVNRVLLQLGLDPAVQVPVELSMSKEKVAELYRNGILDYLNYTQKTFDIKKDKNVDGNEIFSDKEAVSITGRGAGLRVKIYGKYAKSYPKAAALMRAKDRVTPYDGRMLTLGADNRSYVFKDDGFLYEGIVPYTVRIENSQIKLYPISDYAYRLLGLNGEYTGEKGVRRDITEEHHELLRDNLSVVEDILSGKIKSTDIQVVYDKNVLDANKSGSLYLYDWQIPTLKRAAMIKEDPKEDPYATLIPSRGDPIEVRKAGRSSFEQSYFKGSRGNKIGDLIGQYEQRDLDYNQLAREVKKNSNLRSDLKNKILADIYESRRKIHLAAREILKPFLTATESLNSKELSLLRANANFFQLEDYIKNFSKLRFETLDLAIERMGDDFVYVQRVQSGKLTATFGFLSQTELRGHPIVRLLTANGLLIPQLRDIYNLMKNPQAAKELQDNLTLGTKVKLKIAEISRGNKVAEGVISSVVLRIFGSRAKDIQNVEEFESLFMNHYLHAVNRGSKMGISTTADPTYLLTVKTYEQLAKLDVDSGLVNLFKEYKKDSKDPALDAKAWLLEMAQKEKTKKLSVDYYELSWIGAFAKEFKKPIEDVIEVVNKFKSNNDKFTQQDDGTIYVLRIPVEEIDSNYASGYGAQFENTTRKGFGAIQSKWSVISRPLIERSYKGKEKYGVNLAGLSEPARNVYDMMSAHLEPEADFTPYLTFSNLSVKPSKVLGDLFDQNKKVYRQAIKDLKGMKYDLQTVKGAKAVEDFKALVEDVFNTSLKVVEYQKDKDVRKEILEALKYFLRNHATQRGGDQVARWSLELWETVANSKDYSKDVIAKAKSETNIYRKMLNIEVPTVNEKK